MTRGFKDKVRVIEVKPAKEDGSNFLTPQEIHTDASLVRKERPVFQDKHDYKGRKKLQSAVRKNKPGSKENGNAGIEAKENEEANAGAARFVEALIEIKEVDDTRIKLGEDISIQGTLSCEPRNAQTSCDQSVLQTGETEKQKKKRKKKKRKDKKKENTKEPVAPESVSDNEREAVEEMTEADTDTVAKASSKCGRKLPCLFGFIASWFAKRKEKRRAKKRKAIEERNSATPVEQLVEYEHRIARGGESFSLKMDNRPIKMPVLPPIKRRPDAEPCDIDEKMKKAEIKRSEELEKKKRGAKEYETRRAECIERKEDSEFYYKQKVDLTVRHKQSAAQRNRARLQDDRRSCTPSLRAPSTLPPLRIVRVKECNPDDAVFKF